MANQRNGKSGKTVLTQDSLSTVPTGYLYKDSDGLSQELYDSSGLLQNWQQTSGMKLSATYRNSRLQRLTDVFGRQIEFAYTTLAAGDAYIKACLFKSRLDGGGDS